MKYVIGNTLNNDNRGWVIGIKKNKFPIYLHQNLLVEKIGESGDTDEIRILEGVYLNIICSVPPNRYGQSFLVKVFKPKTFHIVLGGSKIYIGKEGYEVVGCPLKTNGMYFVGHPIFQNNIKMPECYFLESKGGSKYSRTWFPIITGDGKLTAYLHFGKLSKGCITIKYQDGKNAWTSIYNKIISSKISDKFLCSLNFER